MPEEKEVFMGKTADGVKVKIYKDKFHFRAFSAPGAQVGEPYVNLVDLLDRNGLILDGPEVGLPGGSRPGQEAGMEQAEAGEGTPNPEE